MLTDNEPPQPIINIPDAVVIKNALNKKEVMAKKQELRNAKIMKNLEISPQMYFDEFNKAVLKYAEDRSPNISFSFHLSDGNYAYSLNALDKQDPLVAKIVRDILAINPDYEFETFNGNTIWFIIKKEPVKKPKPVTKPEPIKEPVEPIKEPEPEPIKEPKKSWFKQFLSLFKSFHFPRP